MQAKLISVTNHFPAMVAVSTIAVSLGMLAIGAVPLHSQDRLNAQQERLFESRIRPVLVEHCYECHSADSDEAAGGLLLDTRGGLRKGGDSGPAVVPGRPESSLLLLAMKHADSKLVMPPKDYGEKLSNSTIADFEAWIRAGALDPREQGNAPEKYGSVESKLWWAWAKPTSPEIPTVAEQASPLGNIDRFVLAKLQAADLVPSEPADRLTLVRRLAIDLTGLPPSQADLKTYALDNPPRPIADLIDQYLASEQYGERFGRHWLDVARYAESTGKDVNVSYPHAWRYRDYVIDAFNSDMPFDQFIKEQLAGDLVPADNAVERARQLIATGFLAIGSKGINEMNPRQFAADLADEQIDAVSQAFLSVTIACARCHDHKFDPISQRDYTAMAGIFFSTETHFGTTGGVGGRNRSTLTTLPGSSETVTTLGKGLSKQELTRLRERITDLEAEQRQFAKDRRAGKVDPSQTNALLRTTTQLVQLRLQLESVDENGNPLAQAMTVEDKPPARVSSGFRERFTRIRNQTMANRQGFGNRAAPELANILDSPQLVRGEIDKPGETVPRGLPEFLAEGYTTNIHRDQSGRLQLSDWIASENNPLTARVIVNRVWAWLLGEGIVSSVDNFGTSGDRPSHPELLDYLATEFVANNWSIKLLVREIVLSKTYQQNSDFRVAEYEVDPENRLLWRANKRSLDAESLRDGMLAISGRLSLNRPVGSIVAEGGDGAIGGRRLGAGVSEEDIVNADPPYRSVYLPIPRAVSPSSLELFDFADNAAVTGARDLTIVPSQALYWMNSPSVEQQCEAIANELLSGAENLTARKLNAVFKSLTFRVLARAPLAAEKQAVADFVRERQRAGKSQLSIWTGVTRSLFASADYRFLR